MMMKYLIGTNLTIMMIESMKVLEIFKLPQVQELDEMILAKTYSNSMIFAGTCENEVKKHEFKKLLEERKSIINKNLDFSPDIIVFLDGFNETLRQELIKLRQETMSLFDSIKMPGLQGEYEAVGTCGLGSDIEFPYLRPLYSACADDVWEKIYDGWYDLYPNSPEQIKWHYHGLPEEKHNWMHGLEVDCQNHNTGLDEKATADMHIIAAAEYFLTQTPFSILDMVYVREFDMNVKVNILSRKKEQENYDEGLDWTKTDYIDGEESIRRYI